VNHTGGDADADRLDATRVSAATAIVVTVEPHGIALGLDAMAGTGQRGGRYHPGFYTRQLLLADRAFRPDTAALALRHAVRALRERARSRPSLWAPFVHVGT
jgi:hypothetical protein